MNNLEKAIDRLNTMYGDWRTDEEKEAIEVAVISLKAWQKVNKCVDFHKLAEKEDRTGFEDIIFDQLMDVLKEGLFK